MAKSNTASEKKSKKSVGASLERLGGRLDECRSVRPGGIDLHLTGASGGEYQINTGRGPTTVTATARSAAEAAPVLEVWGDAETIRAIIDGEKDPVKQFLRGGIRVRGNLRYLSDVGVELGILDRPL